MFKKRLLTTLVLLPLVLGLIYYAPFRILAFGLLLLIAVCAFEWTKMIPCVRLESQIIYLLVVFALILVYRYRLDIWLMIGLVCWLLVLFAVILYPKSQVYWGHRAVVGVMGVVFLPLFANSVIQLYQTHHGQNLIVYAMSLVWAADIGAYLAGKRFGAHKLIPHVSPGKTVEGTVGGTVLALLVALVGYFLFEPSAIVAWFLVALVTVFISILGDLLISLLKRRSHLKDTGNLLPGHGGVLDRLDSSIAALPLFYVAVNCLEFSY
jgi:phosphatidate cytidylyltransferase